MKLKSRNKKLYIHFTHKGELVRKSLKMDDTPANRKMVKQDIIPELQKQLINGVFFEKQNMPTLNEMKVKSFAMRRAKRNLKTQKDYERTYQLHIEPVFGKKKLDRIKASDIEVWQSDLLVTLSPKRVELCRTVLSSIFKSAMKDEKIGINPVSLADAVGKKTIKDKTPFSMDEMNSIINNIDDQVRCYTICGFFTGMRTGELIGLKWSDIDFENSIISIQRSRKDGGDTIPKTVNSLRDIDMIDSLKPFLVEHRRNNPNTEYVFSSKSGKPFYSGNKILDMYWKPVIKKLGIKYRPQYNMRHTFASMMLSEKEELGWVSFMMGHKDSATTLQEYAQYMPKKKGVRGAFLNVQNYTKTAQLENHLLESA